MSWMQRLSERLGVPIGPPVNLGPVTAEQRRELLREEYDAGLDCVDESEE